MSDVRARTRVPPQNKNFGGGDPDVGAPPPTLCRVVSDAREADFLSAFTRFVAVQGIVTFNEYGVDQNPGVVEPVPSSVWPM